MLKADYLGMPLEVADLDIENTAYFSYCSKHEFRLQKCSHCGLLRYPPTTLCCWCNDAGSEWVPVPGVGSVHSYFEVHHAVQPGFKAHTPYLVLLVDLDVQKGIPTEHEALRVVGNLALADGSLAPPDLVQQVGINSRVKMVFADAAPGLSLPQWTLDTSVQQPANVWRYPEKQ